VKKDADDTGTHTMMPIPTLERLVHTARAAGPRRLVVAAAESETALAAAALARRYRIAEVTLVGSRDGILRGLAAVGEDPAHFRLEEAATDADAARRSVAMVRAGAGDVLLKGKLQTAELLRAVLDRAEGLREPGGLLSDVCVADHPCSETPRLLGITDGGVNVAPSLADKKVILENAVRLFRRLGHARPSVACLCAVETVSQGMVHTLEARALAEMATRGEIAGADVFGPLALDNALSPEAAQAKGIDHPVAGRADVLLVPSIEVGNALGKAVTYLSKRHLAHAIVGARAPVLIPSRVESAEDKLFSIALGVLAGGAAPAAEANDA
jgi:phosphate butyryltransferase